MKKIARTLRVVRVVAVAALIVGGSAPASAQNTRFDVVNSSAQTIWKVFVSPSWSDVWGDDRLGTEVLPAGESFQVAPGPRDGCTYDVRVVYRDGGIEERFDQDLCVTYEMVFTGARRIDTRFEIVNRSAQTIWKIFVSPIRSRDWGSDQLGASVLHAGRRLEISPGADDGCLYDVRVEYADNQSEERRRQNLCEISELAF